MIPIPTVDVKCKKTCCTRTYVPLQVAYARTIHTFQGLSAGPTASGTHQYKCIIVDPDKRNYEGKNLGLLYTAISRATTLGDEDGLNSAIYFIGSDFTEARIRNLANKQGTNELFHKAQQREWWVQYLEQHKQHHELTITEQQHILEWAESFQTSTEILRETINKYTHSLTSKQKSMWHQI